MAPTVSLEQLVYATRLMNSASNHGRTAAVNLRNLFVESDVKYDPQAYVLKPEVVLELAEEIIKEPSAYLRTRKAAQTTLMKLRQAGEVGELIYSKIEMRWLDRLTKSADLLPEDEEEFIINALVDIDHSKIRLKEYGVLG
jgi:methanol--5-hydroxybenzimidazolylcobamide Co-methyltransferase